MMTKRNRIYQLTTIIVGVACILNLPALAAEPVIVTVDNFVRAEAAVQFDSVLKLANGEINKFVHIRGPIPLDQQTVIRMNRDTIYSAAVVDISKGATLTIPETNGRYASAMIVNEDHFVNKVYHKPGTHKLTMKDFGTPYVTVSIRTLVNASDPADIKKANAIQDGFTIKSESAIPYAHPDFDQASYEATYKAVIELSRFVPDTKRMFGSKEEVTEVRHLLGTAFGWGGLPEPVWASRSCAKTCSGYGQSRVRFPGSTSLHPGDDRARHT